MLDTECQLTLFWKWYSRYALAVIDSFLAVHVAMFVLEFVFFFAFDIIKKFVNLFISMQMACLSSH